MRIKIIDLLKMAKFNDSKMSEIAKENPKQFITTTDLKIPVWKVSYSYRTARGNDKEGCKYIFLQENEWDLLENEFRSYISSFNLKNQDRQLSNVKILDSEYLGEFILELEN